MMNVKSIEYNPKMEVIVKLIHTLYELPDCHSGGCCHIVTDDDNIEDKDLMEVIDYCHRSDNNDVIDKELSCLICELLLQLSREQRICLFYILNYGYFDDGIVYEEAWNEFFDNVLPCDKIIKGYEDGQW